MKGAARLGVIGAVAVFLAPIVGARPPATAPSPDDYFTVAELARAAAYQSTRVPLALSAWVLGLVVALLVAVGPGARALGSRVERWCDGRWLRMSVVLAAVASILPALSVIPLTWIRHRHDVTFGLATDSTTSAMTDVALASLIALLLAVGAAVGFMAMVRLAPRRWPVVVGAASAIMLVALVALFPVVYEPIFNRFEPLTGPTADRIIGLADDAGVPIKEVLVADASRRTSAHNAYVSGIGSTRRVVLYDTLLDGAPPEEVDLVVAHELAHVRHRDVATGTAFGILGLLLGIWVLWALVRSPRVHVWTGATGPRDPKILPFVAAFVAVAGIITLPSQTYVSRRAEVRADRTALEITGNSATAISLEQRLARTNLSDPSPPTLLHLVFGSHPTTMERIGIAIDVGEQSPSR